MPITDGPSASAAADAADIAFQNAILTLPALVKTCVAARVALNQYHGTTAGAGDSATAQTQALDQTFKTLAPWIDQQFEKARLQSGWDSLVIKLCIPR